MSRILRPRFTGPISVAPFWTSATTGKAYQPGIGPHPEAKTIDLCLKELREIDPGVCQTARTSAAYPSLRRQSCDLAIEVAGDPWFLEVEMMRLFGDNGRPNDNILLHILSPYPAHRSALTDCQKLVQSGFAGRYAVLIYGYEYDEWPLAPVISAFEVLASREVELSSRATALFSDLVHPVHRRGAVYGWESSAKGS